MQTRQAIDTRAFSIMGLLCITWAFQQIAIKVAAPDITPLFQMGIRAGIATLLVCLLMRLRSEPLNLADGSWRPGLVVGFLFALEFLLIGEGLRFTTASHMGVFLYTAPFFAAIGLHWNLPEERLAPAQWAGIAIAFTGVVIVFFGPDTSQSAENAPNILLGDFLGLLAGAAWGSTTVVIRCTSLSNTSATRTLLYQLASAFVLLTLAAIVMGQTQFNFTPVSISAVLFQGIIVSFLTYLTWFWLLRKYLASRLGVFSFMTPLFGIIFGAWLLGEPLDSSFLIGSGCVTVGIILVSGHDWLRQVLLRQVENQEQQ